MLRHALPEPKRDKNDTFLLKSSVELKSAPALETVVLVEVIKTICGLADIPLADDAIPLLCGKELDVFIIK